MTIQQLSVFAENAPGTIYNICRCIGEANVDIRALSVADTQDFGILRLIVSDTAKAAAALKEDGRIVSVTEVIGVPIPDVPGGLAHVLKILGDNDVNVEYIYAFVANAGTSAYVVLRVGDNTRAEEILNAAGISLLTEEEIRSF